MTQDRLTVVVAAYNEAEALPMLHPRIGAVLDTLGREGVSGRVLYVDDGSRDRTWEALQAIAAGDARVSLLRLSRNFGKEAALTAGLDRVDDGAALVLDADGQDPPELIPRFVALWRQGYDDVHGTRTRREGEGPFKRGTAHLFYRLIGFLSHTPIPEDTGDFRLLSPRALDALRQLRERHRFMKGLFGWIGFERVAVPYERAPRLAGRSKFNFWKLWNFALEGITSFSTAPLRVATWLGVATAFLAFLYAAWIVVKAFA
jgi:glycosyltransferase involved in cell wall biosynthesis